MAALGAYDARRSGGQARRRSGSRSESHCGRSGVWRRTRTIMPSRQSLNEVCRASTAKTTNAQRKPLGSSKAKASPTAGSVVKMNVIHVRRPMPEISAMQLLDRDREFDRPGSGLLLEPRIRAARRRSSLADGLGRTAPYAPVAVFNAKGARNGWGPSRCWFRLGLDAVEDAQRLLGRLFGPCGTSATGSEITHRGVAAATPPSEARCV